MILNRNNIKIIFWLLVVMVLVVSSLPGSTVNQSIRHLDKLAHFVAFFVLSILLLSAYKFNKPFTVTALIMVLFGLLIEVIQIYVPYRVFSMRDFAADLLGIISALIMFRIFGSKYTAT